MGARYQRCRDSAVPTKNAAQVPVVACNLEMRSHRQPANPRAPALLRCVDCCFPPQNYLHISQRRPLLPSSVQCASHHRPSSDSFFFTLSPLPPPPSRQPPSIVSCLALGDRARTIPSPHSAFLCPAARSTSPLLESADPLALFLLRTPVRFTTHRWHQRTHSPCWVSIVSPNCLFQPSGVCLWCMPPAHCQPHPAILLSLGTPETGFVSPTSFPIVSSPPRLVLLQGHCRHNPPTPPWTRPPTSQC